jgi:2',3'-cyclic-nucleotide 2'-phosphodiesterase / 3'-nucleotidase
VAAALAGGRHGGLPVVAAVAPFKAGGRGGPWNFTDIPPGPLARRHVADLYSFTNAIRAVLVTGAGLRDWLERSAAAYRHIQPGEAGQILIEPDFPSYNFDMMVGLTYRIAPDRPPGFDVMGAALPQAGERILDLCHEGRLVRDDDQFIVCTNSYRLATWRANPGCPGPQVVFESDEPVRDILCHWITAQPGPVPVPAPGWSLALPPGAAVLFDTSPMAEAADLSPLRAERLGLAPGGFAQFQLFA